MAAERHLAQEDRGWVGVGCTIADLVRHSDLVTVTASLTDLDGNYGSEPKIHTVWGLRLTESDVLDEYRWPGRDGEADRYRCEHYAPGRSA